MDRLIQTGIEASIKRSTETIYEIKAPLASFDTVDLDDEEDEDGLDADKYVYRVTDEEVTNDEGEEKDATPLAEVVEVDFPKGSETTTPVVEQPASLIEEIEADMATTTKTFFQKGLPTTSESTDALTSSGTDQGRSGDTTNGSKEENSSENNASAEDIANKLKIKGRKYKAKSSKVKYEQIENTSDVSDQEKSESMSPLPTVKSKSHHAESDSESESSDSETGFVRSGYTQTSRDKHVTRHFKPNQHVNLVYREDDIKDQVDSDHTPQGSPQVRRPALPPPLSKEESAIRSKRKAYEKRLQRLQVTNTPVERPRSTTPINIVGLEEYASISSPERSPQCSMQEKLKIKLPAEESCRGKSPRRSAKSSATSSAVFTFNEDLLFRCTKSAILLQEDGCKGLSPKRILVPPTLSPKLTPAAFGDFAHVKNSKQPQKYIFSPESSIDTKDSVDHVTDSVDENWATFDDFPCVSDELTMASSDKSEAVANEDDVPSESVESQSTDASHASRDALLLRIEDNLNDNRFDVFDKLEDEVITVQIEERDNEKVWDISLNDKNNVKCDETEVGNGSKSDDGLNDENFSLC